MYCQNCKKDVDINSVAVTNKSSPRAAMTMMGEDFSPTIISGGSTTTGIVNVCKECGESNLFKSREECREFLAARYEQAKTNLKSEINRKKRLKQRRKHFYPIMVIVWVVLSITFTAWLAHDVAGSPASSLPLGSFFSLITCSFIVIIYEFAID